MEEPRKHPLGIVILIVLHTIGGILLAGVLVAGFFIAKDQEMLVRLKAIGVPLPLLVLGVVLLAALALGSAAGMLMAKKWGWYLGSFWYAYAITRALNAVYTVSILTDAMPADEISRAYGKYLGRAFISFLIYLYFFKSNVRQFFDLSAMKPWKVVLIEFGVCIGIAVLVTVCVRFAA